MHDLDSQYRRERPEHEPDPASATCRDHEIRGLLAADHG
jgi:hypothetical protein